MPEQPIPVEHWQSRMNVTAEFMEDAIDARGMIKNALQKNISRSLPEGARVLEFLPMRRDEIAEQRRNQELEPLDPMRLVQIWVMRARVVKERTDGARP